MKNFNQNINLFTDLSEAKQESINGGYTAVASFTSLTSSVGLGTPVAIATGVVNGKPATAEEVSSLLAQGAASLRASFPSFGF
jgi:hypothetical protein